MRASQPERIVICDEICPRCGMHTVLANDMINKKFFYFECGCNKLFWCLKCRCSYKENQLVKSKEKISKEEREQVLELYHKEKLR